MAFSQVVRNLHPMVFAFVLSKTGDMDLTKDILQEMWLKVYERRDVVENLRAYLFTTAKNLVIDNHRKRSGEQFGSDSRVEVKERPQAEINLEEQEVDIQIKATLNEVDYHIWQLHISGYNNEEIAEKLRLTGKTVANRKSMIKDKLREKWK